MFQSAWMRADEPAKQAADASQLPKLLEPLIVAHPGKVAVAVKHLASGEQFQFQADEVMPTASLIKLPLMVTTYAELEAGRADLDSRIELREEDLVPGSGVLTDHFSPGTVLHLRDAIRLMIVFSDNTATNLVVDQVGLDSTAKYMEQLGLQQTKLHSKVYRRDTSIFPERSQQYGLGSTTAAEMLTLLEQLSKQELLTPEACKSMSDHLYACDDKTKLARFLPGVKIAHKTGAVNASRCDAGWIDSPSGRILICVLTTENQDQSWGDENQAEVLCGRIAKATFDYFNPNTQSSSEDSDQPLKLGSRGVLVEGLQRTLNARSDPSPGISVDGDFGPATEAAVIAFQKSQNLPPTGVVDEKLWAALGTIVDDDPDIPDDALAPADSLSGSPFVSCSAWAIADADTGEILWGYRQDESKHPASTTKIMTALVALQMAESDPNLLNERITFSEKADQTIGSSSRIRAGESLPLRELLFGLLLPSGNDASVAIAEFLGQRLQPQPASEGSDESAYDRFITAMNETAQALGLKCTCFENPHGLTSDAHLTSAEDLCRVAAAALKYPLFQEIVSTRYHSCLVQGASGYQRRLLWKNTNRLLGIEGYSGVKTGTTQAAGACLVAVGEREGKRLMVCVLGADSSNDRYLDARNLFRWAWQESADKDVARAVEATSLENE